MIIDQIYALNPNFSDATQTMDSWNSINIKTTEAAKSLNWFKNWLIRSGSIYLLENYLQLWSWN